MCISQLTSNLGREIFILVSEKSGKSQGILFSKMSGNPVFAFDQDISTHFSSALKQVCEQDLVLRGINTSKDC